jgi:ABC-type oligopeptide transport system substrate-binding subunit
MKSMKKILFTIVMLGFAVACGGTKSNDKQSSAEEQKVQTEQTEQAAVDHAAEAKEALLNAKDAMIEGVDHLEDATHHMIQLTVDESKESYKKAKDLTFKTIDTLKNKGARLVVTGAEKIESKVKTRKRSEE